MEFYIVLQDARLQGTDSEGVLVIGFCDIFQPRRIPHGLPAVGSFWMTAPHIAQHQRHSRVFKIHKTSCDLGIQDPSKPSKLSLCHGTRVTMNWDLNRHLQVWSVPAVAVFPLSHPCLASVLHTPCQVVREFD